MKIWQIVELRKKTGELDTQQPVRPTPEGEHYRSQSHLSQQPCRNTCY